MASMYSKRSQRGLISGFVDALLTTNASSRRRDANAGPCYLQILEDAKIISKCTKFDMKSRKSLAGEQKYCLADLSFYFALNTDNRINYGPVLENIAYRYARSLGYDVSVGRIGKLECDFIMRGRDMGCSYVQVAMTIVESEKTEDREYRPLEQIRDNYPKFVITRADPIQRRNGIIHENVTDLIGQGQDFWARSS